MLEQRESTVPCLLFLLFHLEIVCLASILLAIFY